MLEAIRIGGSTTSAILLDPIERRNRAHGPRVGRFRLGAWRERPRPNRFVGVRLIARPTGFPGPPLPRDRRGGTDGERISECGCRVSSRYGRSWFS